jgi:predicted polyphosphate/ATP-dependent NAD kinase
VDGPVVGIIANPVSARDIRRVIANATNLQITDRANIVLRVLSCLRSLGVDRVLMMPESGGIRTHIGRWMLRSQNTGDARFPALDMVRMPVSGTVEDTIAAASAMQHAGVAAIVVLGGDGTHRAVASACGDVPIAGISSGTNNAFPEHREPSLTGIAVGLAVTGRVPAMIAYRPNKRLLVTASGQRRPQIAIVDVAVVSDRYVGARALWRVESFEDLFVTFADPEVIGMSAIAGLLEPVGRNEPGGVHIEICPIAEARFVVEAPIAPGMVRPVGIRRFERIAAGKPVTFTGRGGSIALDGEREFSFDEADRITIALEEKAFRTVDVGAILRYAAQNGLMRKRPDEITVHAAKEETPDGQEPIPAVEG